MTAQTLITSTTGVIAISTAAGGNKWRGLSLYTAHVVKRLISESATRYNQILGGLNLRVGQLFPSNEVPN